MAGGGGAAAGKQGRRIDKAIVELRAGIGLPHARRGAARAPARGPAALVASRGPAWLRCPLRRRSVKGEGRRRVGAARRRERRGGDLGWPEKMDGDGRLA